MNSITTSHRLYAITLAIGITFGLVWALSSHAYSEPAGAGPLPLVKRSVQAKACS